MWQNSKIQIVTKLKTSNCDQTQKLKLGKTKSKTQIVTILKTQIVTKLKMWQNSKTIIVTKKLKKKKIVTELKNSNGGKTQILKLSQNSNNLMVTKINKNIVTKIFKKKNCEKTQKTQIVTKLKLWQN